MHLETTDELDAAVGELARNLTPQRGELANAGRTYTPHLRRIRVRSVLSRLDDFEGRRAARSR